MAMFNSEINQFNSWLTTSVPSYGSNFDVVDTYDAFMSSGAINSSYYVDGIHPNVAGYNAMGNVWNAAIQADVVPEPSSLSLLTAGFLLLGVAIYRGKLVGTT